MPSLSFCESSGAVILAVACSQESCIGCNVPDIGHMPAWSIRILPRQNKPVAFYGPIAPPVPNAPSSECRQASIAGRRRAAGSMTIMLPSVVLLQQCPCGKCHRGKLQNLSPPSVLFESSWIFFTIHRRHRRKKWWTRISKFEFCDFWEFF